jgi:hypothetical protein
MITFKKKKKSVQILWQSHRSIVEICARERRVISREKHERERVNGMKQSGQMQEANISH